MPSERDPRKDPKPGDVLRNGFKTLHVLFSDSRMVRYKLGALKPVLHADSEGWREWAKDAEVIHRAD